MKGEKGAYVQGLKLTVSYGGTADPYMPAKL